MSRNLAWLDLGYFKDFRYAKNKIILISNNNEKVFHIELNGDTLLIYGETYFDGKKIYFNHEGIHYEHSAVNFRHLSFANVDTDKIHKLKRSTLLLSEGARNVLTLGYEEDLKALPKSCIKMAVSSRS
jgi:hypothetical protein